MTDDRPPLPRVLKRLLGPMSKKGRRGRKARAKAQRILKSKVPEAYRARQTH